MESNNNALTDQQMANANAGLQAPDVRIALKALKVESATPPLPAHVQANLQRAFRAQHAANGAATALGANSLGLNLSGWRGTFAAHLAPLFAVAVVLVGTAGLFMAKQQNTENSNGWESPKIGHLQAPFIALKDINLIALELNTTIVETQLSPTQLSRLGIPISPESATGFTVAQVLMSDSGEPLALKLDY